MYYKQEVLFVNYFRTISSLNSGRENKNQGRIEPGTILEQFGYRFLNFGCMRFGRPN